MNNTSNYEANKLTDTFANHLEYLKFIREIDSNEQKKYCETIVSDDGSCGCFSEQSELKTIADNKNNFENELEISLLNPKAQEDVFAKIERTVSLSDDTKIILGGILISLISLVLLICILAFFNL
jgi:hypothetical protein